MDPLTLISLITLGVGLASGTLTGVLGAKAATSEYDKEVEDLERKQREYLIDDTDDYTSEIEDELNLLDLTFEEKKKDAEHSADLKDIEADRTDSLATQTETAANNDFANQFDLLNLSWQQDALNFNNANMQIGQSTGNALSTAAASGTRTSSMNDAIALEAANNEAQLQLQEDTTRANNNYQVTSLLNSLSNSKNSVQQNRWNALDLRNAADYTRWQYGEGGTEYNIYKANRDKTVSDAERTYNEYQAELDYYGTKSNRRNAMWSGFFSGFSGGFNTGKDITSLFGDIFGKKS